MIFQRVPYEKRLHWLWMWNVDNDPTKVDCSLALDTVSFYTSTKTQSLMKYYEGHYTGIMEAKREFDLCLAVKGISNSNPEKARVSLSCMYNTNAHLSIVDLPLILSFFRRFICRHYLKRM